jgi:Cytochrome P460
MFATFPPVSTKSERNWPTIAVSHNGDKLATILGNPAMIEAYKAGIPGNGKPFPDGVRMAKIHWVAKKDEAPPGEPIVPGPLHDIDFMVKDSKKFTDSGGWGYAQFDYHPASDTFKPGDAQSEPPQEHDAKSGLHAIRSWQARIMSSRLIRSGERHHRRKPLQPCR